MNGKIKKRNGDLVDFDSKKIFIAIKKAFEACQVDVNEVEISEIVRNAIEYLEKAFVENNPGVEDVQNFVEKALMEAEYYAVAKAYIIYRYEHTKEREKKKEEVLEKIEKNDLYVTKRSGERQKFEINKIRKSIQHFIKDLKDVDLDLLVKNCEPNLYDGIKTSEISKAVVLTARGCIELDPAYSKLASRLLFNSLYKDVIGPDVIDYKKLESQYQKSFIDSVKEGVKIGRLSEKLLDFDLESVSKLIKPERDDLFVYLGAQTLHDRYFISNPETKKVIETPQTFWMRVAMGLSINEKDRIEAVTRFYEIISTLRFIPSTPTLFHAGTAHPQLSSCYLTTIDDSLDHIFKCIGDNAQLSKWSGGVANDWTNLRATGALIKGTGVESQGAIPFLKIANDTTVAINRSGRRRGATCAYMEVWHYDFEDFLELRKNTGDERRRTHDMNTASWIPDLFMKRLADGGDWTLLSPEEAPELHHIYGKEFEEKYTHYENLAKEGKMRLFKTVKAADLWKKMIMMLFETGHPWITWKDPSNIRSPQDHVGVVHSSNLCTEITLNTSNEETAVCNLGSVNLPKHIKDGKLNIELIKDTVTTAMRMLDNVIDINFYPTIEGKTSNLRHRPVGLGVMGFQDALYLIDVPFDSSDCVKFSDQCQEAISYYAILASSDLAKERGVYESYKGSKWDRGILPMDTIDLLEEQRGREVRVDRSSTMDWDVVRKAVKKNGMRNSNCMAIAPTATISNIAGSFPTIEPIYKNVYVKSNMSGEFIIVNQYLVKDLKSRDLWNKDLLEQIKGNDGNISEVEGIPDELKDKYKEVFDIEPEWLVKAAAARGKWIDQSQSLNIFIKGTSGKKISDIYQYAWNTGLKTTYYLRSLGATGVEKSSLDLNKQKSMSTVQKTTSELKSTPAIAVKPEVANAVKAKAPVKLCKINDPDCEACQ